MNTNMSTSIEYLDNIESNNANDVDGLKVNDNQNNNKGVIWKSLFNETNILLVVLVSILLYPGTLQFITNFSYMRILAKSNFFFIIQAIVIVLLQVIVTNIYVEN